MRRDGRRRVAGLLDGVPIPMLAVDGQARTIAANRAAEALFGPDLLNRPFVTILRHPDVIAALDRALDPESPTPPGPQLGPQLGPDAQRHAPQDGPARLRAQIAADGRLVAAEITVAPLPPALGRGATVAIIDRSAAEEAEQLRRDFVANVSHELKTPLTAMTGFIQTLRGPARDDPAARDRFWISWTPRLRG